MRFRKDHWPASDPRDPGTRPEDQDRELHKVPALVLVETIFADLTAPRDRVYNR